jgi:hypothetical protein
MKNYYLYNDRIEIIYSDGTSGTIFLNGNSGKVYYRFKIDTISGIKHPGIFLGTDYNGEGWFLHNHFLTGKASFITESNFRKNQPIYLYTEKCSNAPLTVIDIGLKQVLAGESYKPVSYNCQTFVNQACNNQRRSDSVEKWVSGLFIAGLIVAGISIASSSSK